MAEIDWKARHDEVLAVLDALGAAAVSEVREHAGRHAKGDVRCTACNLRWDERDQYGCRWPGQGHSYDEHELAQAETRAAAEVDERYVSIDLADLRAAVADPAAVLAERDARVKAEAWDEGYVAAMNNAYRNPATGNPYREGQA